MDNKKILDIALKEAIDLWINISKKCLIFNQGARLESIGNIGASILSFGIAAARIVPPQQRKISDHINNLEKNLYDLKKRVERCILLSHSEQNIYLLLLDKEKEIYGENILLHCGYISIEYNMKEECNIAEVSYHLINCNNSDYFGDKNTQNAVKDICNRQKMICKSKRLMSSKQITPKLFVSSEIFERWQLTSWKSGIKKTTEELSKNRIQRRIKKITEELSKNRIQLEYWESIPKGRYKEEYIKENIKLYKDCIKRNKASISMWTDSIEKLYTD